MNAPFSKSSIVQRKKPTQRLFTGLAGSVLAVVEPEPPLPSPEPKRTGRPPKHDRAMTSAERKRNSRLKKVNDVELERLIAEQKIDDATDGRGAGMIMKNAPSKKGQLVSGGFGAVYGIENILTAVAHKQFQLVTFGGRKAKGGPNTGDGSGNTPSVDAEGGEEETDSKFQKRHPIRSNWTYDIRDKEEIARHAAPGFIQVFDPRSCLRWDQTLCEFVPWDEVMCIICRRVFSFPSYAVNHIVEIIGAVKITRPEFHAEEVHNRDITRHRRVVLKGIGEYQPIRIKKPKIDS